MPAVMDAPPEGKRKLYKMRLRNPEFIEQLGGKLPAGSVVIVDEDTAIRWLDLNIADQAGKDEQTVREKRRAELLARLTPIDDDDEDAPAVLASPRRASATGRPTRRTQGSVRRNLVGGGVVNSLDDVPEQITASDDDEDDE